MGQSTLAAHDGVEVVRWGMKTGGWCLCPNKMGRIGVRGSGAGSELRAGGTARSELSHARFALSARQHCPAVSAAERAVFSAFRQIVLRHP